MRVLRRLWSLFFAVVLTAVASDATAQISGATSQSQNAPGTTKPLPDTPPVATDQEAEEDADVAKPTPAPQLPQSVAPQPAEQTPLAHSGRGRGSELYVKLRDTGLDRTRVYKIRDAFIDREDLHVKIEDGIIAFSAPVDGHITAGFFEGEGVALLAPPDNVERWSLNVFSGAAILEERFATAFLRFNDELFEELHPYLRAVEPADAQAFITKWDAAVRQLSSAAALRVATTILNGESVQPGGKIAYRRNPADRVLVMRCVGERIGFFDLVFDTLQAEQIAVGRLAKLPNGADTYDVWTSFPMRSARAAAAGASRRATITTQASAELGTPEPFRVNKYTLKVRVQPPHTIESDAVLEVGIRTGGDRVLRFELSRYLHVREVLVDGKQLDFMQNQALHGTELARRGDDVVAVVFQQPLAAGTKMQLRFLYSGDVMSEAGGGLMYVGSRGAWYPNRGLAMSDYDMEFQYPPGWTLVATGSRVSKSQAANGERIERYVSERPVPLAGFNLGRYVTNEAQSGRVQIATYAASGVENTFPAQRASAVLPEARTHRADAVPAMPAPPPPNPSQNLRAITERASRDLEFLSRTLGPYPFRSFSLTQMPGGESNSWPGLVFLSSYVFLSPEERRAARIGPWGELVYSKIMQTHETVHQWIGDLIIWRSYREQWIVEALSNYIALLKLEQENPQEFRATLNHYRDELISKNTDGVEVTQAGPVTLGQRLNSSRFPDGYDSISYGRGTWLFHMLRHMLLENFEAKRVGVQAGPNEPFVAALRTIRERFEGREITTRDLQGVFEQYLPASLRYEDRKSLDWFFDTWVNGTSVPQISLEDVKIVTTKGVTTARGKIVQKNAPSTLVTSVPLYSVDGTLLARVFAEGPETVFRINVPSTTKSIVFDPQGTILRR